MKCGKIIGVSVLLCALQLSCVNGKDKIGTPLDPSQLPKPDTVAYLTPYTEVDTLSEELLLDTDSLEVDIEGKDSLANL